MTTEEAGEACVSVQPNLLSIYTAKKTTSSDNLQEVEEYIETVVTEETFKSDEAQKVTEAKEPEVVMEIEETVDSRNKGSCMLEQKQLIVGLGQVEEEHLGVYIDPSVKATGFPDMIEPGRQGGLELSVTSDKTLPKGVTLVGKAIAIETEETTSEKIGVPLPCLHT